MMNRSYNEIMQLIGADEFKALIKKWERLSANIKKDPPKMPILLPNLLWVGSSGIGRTQLMSLMSEYLYAKGNLMDFYGDVKFFEFMLNYTPKDQTFTQLQRLEDELDVAAGFRNDFHGAILIDIDPWVNHFEELYFAGFMEYLSAHSDQWMIVLSVSEHDAEKLQNLEAFLSMYLRLDKVVLSMPETDELYAFVEKNLKGYDLELDSSAKELLLGTIQELRSNRHFDGFKSLKMLCQEIAYEHFSTADAARDMLTAADLTDFAAGSNYVKKTIHNSTKMHKIGFGRWEE